MADIGRMKELIDILNRASAVYYQGKDEIMSNFEYDKYHTDSFNFSTLYIFIEYYFLYILYYLTYFFWS